ncbi:hypothetical protein BGZ57DRAFT_931651 [Hyaloscypha finlandica]|nr:hypothetical protein BGZ57DRAFT_931651 [Hyaloscypha finlandica]
MSSSSRKRDPGRKRTKAADPDEESGGEGPQPRASHHPKTPQKPPTSIIKGDVHIKSVKGNVYLVQGSRDDELPQRSPTPTRNPTRRQQPTRTVKRSTAQCDSPSASEEDETSASDDTEPEYVAPRRSAKSMMPLERPRMHSEKKKRDQADEGYHTSGTVSYTAQVLGKAKGKGKGKERSVSSIGSVSSRPRRDSKMSKETGCETDTSSCHADGDNGDEVSAEEEEGQPEQNAPYEEDEASDDDFLKLPIHIGNPKNLDTPAIGEKAILDTGTKGDWISQTFYNELRDMGVRSTKLSAEELDVQYRDFNGKKFQPTAKVDLTIQTEEFKGSMKCRTMRFLVASKATFTILFGRDTIRKHKFFTRSKRDTDGEEVLIGVHDELNEAQKAETRRKKEEQKKLSSERKKARDSKTEKAAREKENGSAASSSKDAHLATTEPRRGKTRLPSKESARKSSSSMEDCTW